MRRYVLILALTLVGATTLPAAQAQSSEENLSRQLSNPVADLVSLPLQLNVEFGSGATGDGVAYTLNVQPVVPFRLNEDWNLISRTVMPIALREDVFPGDDNVGGLGDTIQSFFFSPTSSASGGLIWGVGPALLLPTATDDLLGGKKWGIGPTGVLLSQNGPWSAGVLANHLWSFAGEDSRPDVNASYLQPFAAYSIGEGRSITSNIEASYDWDSKQWNVPVAVGYSQVFTIGEQAMSFFVGARYFVEAPSNGSNWGLRTALVFLFPR